MKSARGDEGFTRYRSRQAISWTLANLSRLHTGGSLLDCDPPRPFEQSPVVVVGAGPSLESHGIDLLKGLKGSGVPIVTVNAADPVLRKAGITPTMMVVRDCGAHKAQLVADSEAPVIALDVSVHPDTWDAAGDARRAWFLPLYPRHLHVAQRLGVRPIAAGTSALTTAVSLVEALGAGRIILVGVDLSHAPDGRMYASGAPRGDARVRRKPGATDVGLIENDEGSDERERASGLEPLPKAVRLHRVVSHDFGSTRQTTEELLDQIDWLTTFARRHGARVELHNASRGAGILGWSATQGIPLSGPTASALSPRRVVTEEHTAALREELLSECRRLEAIADRLTQPGGPELISLNDYALLTGAPLVATLAAHRLLDIHEPGLAGALAQQHAFSTAATEATDILQTAGAA